MSAGGCWSELGEATTENVERLEAERVGAVQAIAALKEQVEALDVAMASAVAVNQARDVLSKREAEAQDALSLYARTKPLADEGDAAVAKLDATLEGLHASLDANAYDPGRHQALGVALERVKALVADARIDRPDNEGARGRVAAGQERGCSSRKGTGGTRSGRGGDARSRGSAHRGTTAQPGGVGAAGTEGG